MNEVGTTWRKAVGINGNRVLKKHLDHSIRLEHEKYPDVDDIYIYCADCSCAIVKVNIRGEISFATSIIGD